MKAQILDTRKDGNNHCYLCKISLYDFIDSLPVQFQDFDIQREIVSNIYLDNLAETVLEKKHIPPIVLVVESGRYKTQKDLLNVVEFKILDGLQRTYRLKIIWETINQFEKEIAKGNIQQLNRLQLSKKYGETLFKINSSTKILESIITCSVKSKGKINLKDAYTDNFQWFEIWTDLTPAQEVEKMLILNAGHKPVKIKHQLEILFLNVLPLFKSINLAKFKLVREKQKSSISYSKTRTLGEFHFSHLITSIISLKEGEPITTNADLINEIQRSELNINEYANYLGYDFLVQFVTTLLALDEFLFASYKTVGTKWIGREVVLDGLFAALGRYSRESELSPIEGLDTFRELLKDEKIDFKLNNFEVERNRLELSKVNLGNVNKRAVFRAMYDLISGDVKVISWGKYFKA